MSNEHYWITGIHAVTEVIKQRSGSISKLLLKADRDDARLIALKRLAVEHNVKAEEVDAEILSKISEDTHQGVAAELSANKVTMSEKELLSHLDAIEHDPLLLVLDGITDPHNLGACLRTADAAGVDAVIIPKNKSASLNSTVSRVASGAAETVNVVSVTNLARCLEALKEKNIWIAGTDDATETSLYRQNLTGGLALVMGSEGSGLRRLTKESCDYLIAIPMAGQISSLNVSVAAGVALFEAVRQRTAKSE
ncbi:MAG: 23S rRNA (guanosine(2251)-2'-O)-methyltransferase RlmB [Pseudomonadales bacterium]|nr:23S rRNA (guanosine(2251)-2'-O)-methyltransferase RlmB [Pseudomonadales bacterium]